MLVASYAAFYSHVAIVDGVVQPSDPYGTLRFFTFPTRPQTLHLVMRLYQTAAARGTLTHRLRRGMDELERGRSLEVQFPDHGGPRQFDYVYDVRDVVFLREGSYAVDVLLDRAVLCTATLSVVQIK